MSQRILINGLPVDPAGDVSIVECEPGVYSVLQAGASFEIRVTADRIEVDGHPVRYATEDLRQWKRSSALAGAGGRANITAPMPGKVVRILVAVGDMVTAGQGIVVIEAMKMLNPIEADRAGRIIRIHLADATPVEPGVALFDLEPDPA